MNIIRYILTATFLILTLTACGEKTVEVEKIIEVEAIVEVEKEPILLEFYFTGFGLDAQDNYPEIISGDELPNSLYLDSPTINLYFKNSDNIWEHLGEHNVNLDGSIATLTVYQEGTYSYYASDGVYATNGTDYDYQYHRASNVIEIKEGINTININMLPSVYADELDTLDWSGERIANVLDYMKTGEPCYKIQDISKYNIEHAGTVIETNMAFLCREDSDLTDIKLQMGVNNKVEFTTDILEGLLGGGGYQHDPIIYPGNSTVTNKNIPLTRGMNYIHFKVSSTDDNVNIFIPEISYITENIEYTIDNVLNYTSTRIDYAEFHVPNRKHEISFIAKYGSIEVSAICASADETLYEFKLNGEMVQVSFYTDDNFACINPTGREGSNIYLDVFPDYQLNTWDYWTIESEIPSFRLEQLTGTNYYSHEGVEEKELVWKRSE